MCLQTTLTYSRKFCYQICDILFVWKLHNLTEYIIQTETNYTPCWSGIEVLHRPWNGSGRCWAGGCTGAWSSLGFHLADSFFYLDFHTKKTKACEDYLCLENIFCRARISLLIFCTGIFLIGAFCLSIIEWNLCENILKQLYIVSI